MKTKNMKCYCKDKITPEILSSICSCIITIVITVILYQMWWNDYNQLVTESKNYKETPLNNEKFNVSCRVVYIPTLVGFSAFGATGGLIMYNFTDVEEKYVALDEVLGDFRLAANTYLKSTDYYFKITNKSQCDGGNPASNFTLGSGRTLMQVPDINNFYNLSYRPMFRRDKDTHCNILKDTFQFSVKITDDLQEVQFTTLNFAFWGSVRLSYEQFSLFDVAKIVLDMVKAEIGRYAESSFECVQEGIKGELHSLDTTSQHPNLAMIVVSGFALLLLLLPNTLFEPLVVTETSSHVMEQDKTISDLKSKQDTLQSKQDTLHLEQRMSDILKIQDTMFNEFKNLQCQRWTDSETREANLKQETTTSLKAIESSLKSVIDDLNSLKQAYQLAAQENNAKFSSISEKITNLEKKLML